MQALSRLLRTRLMIKLRSWEYWPFLVVHAPLFLYWLWLSLKARSLVFFSASNPGILMGGMFGESKFDVLEKVPEALKPKTIRISAQTDIDAVMGEISRHGLSFPLIFKPDLGERGWLVKKIEGRDDVESYVKMIHLPFLIQEFVDLPLEFGVFYIRYPRESSGRVISIAGKEMLAVTGNGKHTLRELMLSNDRAKLQWENLQFSFSDQLDKVIPDSQTIELVSIGNHCLGTKFLDANHLITDRLSESFDRISKQVEGFFFGRYDLRTASVKDLEEGKVMIMELNGCGAEPSHIYQPGFSLFAAQRVLFHHWSDIYRVSAENHKNGVPYISFREARLIYKQFTALTAS